jgi:hypothetical protein
MKRTLLAVLYVGLMCSSVNAAMICESDNKGRTCCWDSEKYGTIKPPFVCG